MVVLLEGRAGMLVLLEGRMGTLELSGIRVGLTEEEGMMESLEVIMSSITSVAGVDSRGASEYLKLILFLNCCGEGENTGVVKGNLILLIRVVVGAVVVVVVVDVLL